MTSMQLICFRVCFIFVLLLFTHVGRGAQGAVEHQLQRVLQSVGHSRIRHIMLRGAHYSRQDNILQRKRREANGNGANDTRGVPDGPVCLAPGSR